jgi:Adenylate cyclase, family 3 (some proteins contain HAMP domain)
MPRLQSRSFASSDQQRTMPKGHAAIVTLDEVTIGHASWEPGWRWSTHLQPIAGTPTCELHHLGYSVSGTLHVEMSDGQTLDIGPGSVYEIPPGHDAWVVGDAPWETIEWTSARAVGIAPDDPGDRVLATVVFTDIVDSTATLERLGDAAWRDLLQTHNARLREAIDRFRGREVATTGDGFLAVFDSPTRAVRAAEAMSRAASRLGVPIRVGVHTGEIELVGSDVRGVAVHAAARVLSLAGRDEVLVSSTTSDLLEGSGAVLRDAGEHELKGLAGRRRLFRLVSSSDRATPEPGSTVG